MFSDGLFNCVITDTGVQTQLGTNRGDGTAGVFPMIAPEQATLPFMVYQLVSHEQVIAFEGVNRYQRSKFRFTCYGSTYRNAHLLCDALKNLLNGLFRFFNEGTEVQGAWQTMEMDDSEPLPHGTVFAVH